MNSHQRRVIKRRIAKFLKVGQEVQVSTSYVLSHSNLNGTIQMKTRKCVIVAAFDPELPHDGTVLVGNPAWAGHDGQSGSFPIPNKQIMSLVANNHCWWVPKSDIFVK